MLLDRHKISEHPYLRYQQHEEPEKLPYLQAALANPYTAVLNQTLLNASPANKTQQYHNHRDHQQDMNEATDGVGRDKAEQPQDQ